MDATSSTDQIIAGFEILVKFASLAGIVAFDKAFVESQKLAKEEEFEKLVKKEDLATLASEVVAVNTEACETKGWLPAAKPATDSKAQGTKAFRSIRRLIR
jgi:hypothetical protein